MDRGAWWAAVHGVVKTQTWLSDFTFTFHFHALEKEMATHSSTLACKIPWMGEPGRLQSMGSQRVSHDWMTSRSHFCDTWSSSNNLWGPPIFAAQGHPPRFTSVKTLLFDIRLQKGHIRFLKGISGYLSFEERHRAVLLKPRHWQTIIENVGHLKQQHPVTLSWTSSEKKQLWFLDPPWIPWGFMNLLGKCSCHSQELKF